MIIEFNGLPGTGKTTVAKELGEKLSQKGLRYQVCTDMVHITKREIVSCMLRGGWKVFLYAVRFAKKGISADTKNREKIALVTLYYYDLYCKNEKKDSEKILICDQGIFQSLISIAHIDEIKNSKYAQRVIAHIVRKNIFFVNCNVNPQLSEKRLKLRKNGGSRFDKMNEEERYKNLLIQQQNFETLSNCLEEVAESERIIKIDTINDPEENAGIIYDKIIKKVVYEKTS